MTVRTPVVELLDASRLHSEGGVPVRALVDSTLVVDREEYVAVVGPSGSGKSTMLNLLGLLDRPSNGVYRLEGIDTSALSEGQRAGLRSRRIGFVFQSSHILPHRSVLENVLISTIYNKMPRLMRVPAATEALRRVALGDRIGFRPSQLSGGEQQRMAIARAIVTRPALLLCDEPTGNLDSGTGEAILTLFDELRADGLTLIVVTHDHLVSARADRVVQLRDGRVEGRA